MAKTAKLIGSHQVHCSDPACKTEALIDVYDCGCRSVSVLNIAPKPHHCVVEFESKATVAKGCKVHTKKGLIRKTFGVVLKVGSIALTITKLVGGF